MTDFLIRCFIRNSSDTDHDQVRMKYGILAACTGMACNILLFIIKYIIGVMAGSIAIISDGFNNLCDCLSNVITLAGSRLAARPADREHPFGHGRIEYVVSFVISILIMITAWELFRDSAVRIFTPAKVKLEPVMIAVMVMSCLVKLWMSFFYRSIGKRTGNTAMEASSADSRNDVVTTAGAIISALLTVYIPSIPFDGIGGVLIAVFICWSGIGIARDIITRLLGRPADRSLTIQIRNVVLSYPEIIGIHDVILHDYGAGSMIGSAHAEVPSDMTLIEAHRIIDRAERKVARELNVQLTLHMDPIAINDPESNRYRIRVLRTLKALDERLSMHDFQMMRRDSERILTFDVLCPYECTLDHIVIERTIASIFDESESVSLRIFFDHGFTQEDK